MAVVCFFGHAEGLAGYQFPDQGLNPGPHSVTITLDLQGTPKMAVLLLSVHPLLDQVPASPIPYSHD